MQRNRLVVFALFSVLAGLGACAALLAAAPGQARYTGTPADIIRVNVINSGRSEAIPVSLTESASPLKVEVGNKPTVVLDPATVVTARIQPRTWEYKLVTVHPNGNDDDEARVLTAMGAQGWDVTGVVLPTPAGAKLLLKRQK